MRGVNLGGWLVLEPWITPSLFKSTNCVDEYSLCEHLGSDASIKLNKFRDNFITKGDFEWIAAQGLNAIRLPVGYWILEMQSPYISTMDYVDKAMNWAKQYGLGLVLCLHGAPGSQNGKNHSGKTGEVGWHRSSSNIQLTLKVIEQIVIRYKTHPSLTGIELLNEPNWRVPKRVLKEFYREAYVLIRKNLGDSVYVIINDHYKPGFWKKFSAKNGYTNMLIDRHIYQAYKRDSRRNLDSTIKKTVGLKNQIIRTQKISPLIVGEWSLALHHQSRAVAQEGRDKVMRAYATAQMEAFSDAAGWFYWTYKTEDSGPWNLRAAVEKSWIKL